MNSVDLAESEITDNRGECYTLTRSHDKNLIRWEISNANRQIGYANVWVVGSEFKIHDIRLIEPRVLKRTWVDRTLFRAPRITNYRRRGLGTILLQKVIEFAKIHGFESITGDIVAQDATANPRLISWYEKHGFEFTPSGHHKNHGKIRAQL